MKVLNIAKQKLYRFNCPECGAKLEASPDELTDVGNKISKFHCPVCDEDRFIGWREIRKRIVYDDDASQN